MNSYLKERDIPASLDMINPGSPGQGMPLRTLAFIGQLYGKPGIEFYRQARDLGSSNGIDNSLRDQAERHFFRRLRSRYHLPRWVNPLHFYKECETDATTSITELVGKFPGLQQTLELAEEAKVWTEHPTDALKMLAWSDQDMPPRTRFELIRREILADSVGQINSRVTSDQPRNVVLDALLVLNKQVYERAGDGDPYESHSYHDVVTNTFKGIVKNGNLPPGSIERKHPFTVRTAKGGIGPIYTCSRLKEADSTVFKALVKANRKENGGVVNPDDVLDNSGILYVVMDETKLHPFVGKVLEALQHHHPRGVVSIKGDNNAGTDRGQAPRLNFQRWQLTFRDSITPLELQFYKLGDYLNQIYEVGKKDRQSGYYLGRAHELYDLRRIADLLNRLFPEVFYGDKPKKAISIAMDQKAEELRGRNRVN